jgi:hypothetical protein
MDAISGVIPKNSITEDAVLQLMAIYRKQALDASDTESAQRVLRRLAETQRVQTEQGIATETQIVPTAQVDMSPDLGIFEFVQPDDSSHIETRDALHHPQFISPFITQDDDDLPPASNTRQRCKGTLTQD